MLKQDTKNRAEAIFEQAPRDYIKTILIPIDGSGQEWKDEQ
jgi:hypothetical protein